MKQNVTRQLRQIFGLLGTENLKKLAIETGFIKRNRAFNAFQFLQFLFEQHDQLIDKPLESLCLDLSKNHQIHLTKSSLNKRFTGELVQFLHAILTALFQISGQKMLGQTNHQPFRRIRIMDSTTIQLPASYEQMFQGIHCSSVKIHLEFDYLSQHLLYYQLTNGRASDNPVGKGRLHLIEKGELVLQDLGYFDFEFFEGVQKQGAYFLTKTRKDTQFFMEVENPPVHPNGKKIESRRYQRLVLEDELAHLERGEMKEWPILYVGRRQKIPVRCVIYRQTEAQEAQSTERENRRRQKKQKQNHKTSVGQLAALTVYITNIEEEKMPAEQIHSLYQWRWQIELLFKTWKSDLQVDAIKQVKIERWLCHLYTQLIVLFFSQWIMGSFRRYWMEAKEVQLSERKSTRFLAKQINRLLEAFRKSVRSWRTCIHQLMEDVYLHCRKSIKHTTCRMS